MAVVCVWHSSALMLSTFLMKFWNAYELYDRQGLMGNSCLPVIKCRQRRAHFTVGLESR